MQLNMRLASSARLGLLTVMLAAVFWGTGGAIAKSLYETTNTNPTSVAFFRMALSVPVLAVISSLTLGKHAFAVHRHDLPFMLMAGTLVGLYQVAYFAAIPRIGIAIATVIAISSAPILVAVLNAVFTRQWPPGIVLIALVCAIVGTVLLVNVEPNVQQTDVLGGVLLALLSGSLYAINILVGSKLGSGGRAHPLQITTVGFAFGALVLLVVALASGFVIQYPLDGWLRLGYLGAFPTAIAYALFYSGMRSTGATAASIATLTEPLTATIIAVVVFHEPLSPQAFLGAVLMIAAMVLLMLRRR